MIFIDWRTQKISPPDVDEGIVSQPTPTIVLETYNLLSRTPTVKANISFFYNLTFLEENIEQFYFPIIKYKLQLYSLKFHISKV